jgi:RNA polymerase sigma-70 factor, ECF subfamily
MDGPSTGRDDERRSAFEAISVPLMKTLHARAVHLTRHADAAADLVQETYLRAFRTFDNFARGSNAKAWMLTILYSLFVSRYRKLQREVETIPIEDAEVAASSEIEPRAMLDPRLWASDEVHASLQRLPESFRVVLLMVDVDDMTYEQTAAALACPVGTVRSRLSRARKMLFTELLDYARGRGFGREVQ